MAEFSLPHILSLAGIRGYSPRLANSVNTLLNTTSDIEYKEALKQATKEVNGFSQVTVYDELDTQGVSDFNGLPIYMPLIFEALDNGNSEFVLDSAIVSVNRTKNIVITEVQGRDSSVKEFINNGDFQISVNGLICQSKVGYPTTQVKQFHKFLEAKQSLDITHDVLNMLGIYEIVILDYDLPESYMINAQPFSFNAISETPLQLRIDS